MFVLSTLVMLPLAVKCTPAAAFDSFTIAERPALRRQIDIENWRYVRGAATDMMPPNATCQRDQCRITFDDSSWISVSVPHDFEIEDLPPRNASTVPVLAPRDGMWRFQEGDNLSWSAVSLADTRWRQVPVPADWRSYGLSANGTRGWFRRHLTLPNPAELAASDAGTLRLALGTVGDADETFVNGIKVGGVGQMGDGPDCRDATCSVITIPQSCGSGTNFRSYLLPRGILRNDSLNVLAVRVHSLSGLRAAGGLVDTDPAGSDRRVGPFDPGASAGGLSVGYTVGGVGWYRAHLPLKLQEIELITCGAARAFLTLDGAYMNSQAWLNGRFLGAHPYGFTPITYDLTPSIRASQVDATSPSGASSHVLAVRLDGRGSSSCVGLSARARACVFDRMHSAYDTRMCNRVDQRTQALLVGVSCSASNMYIPTLGFPAQAMVYGWWPTSSSTPYHCAC